MTPLTGTVCAVEIYTSKYFNCILKYLLQHPEIIVCALAALVLMLTKFHYPKT
jgi:hypothetical protein